MKVLGNKIFKRILLKILLPKTFMLLKEIFCDKITTLLEIVEILQNNWK